MSPSSSDCAAVAVPSVIGAPLPVRSMMPAPLAVPVMASAPVTSVEAAPVNVAVTVLAGADPVVAKVQPVSWILKNTGLVIPPVARQM